MKRRAALALGGLLAAGCTTAPWQGRFDAALLTQQKPAPPATPLPGRVALLVRPPAEPMVDTQVQWTPLRIPVPAIAENAVLLALAEGWRDGAARWPVVPPAPAGVAATLVLDGMRGRYDAVRGMPVPVPVPPFVLPGADFRAQVEFDVRLLDRQGQEVWRHHYDSGPQVWKRPSFWSNEPFPEGLNRLTHELAWQLAQRLLADVRAWVLEDRQAPRTL